MTKNTVKRLATEIGFDLAGIASAEPVTEWLFYPEWIERGYAGEMEYLKGRRGEMRADPRTLLPTAKSIICLGLSYNSPGPYSTDADLGSSAWISRYAWGQDYHPVLKKRLHALAGALEREVGPYDYKVCVDTAPVLERAYAHRAGLGWIAKNTCLINEKLGSWIFLGELITSLEIEADEPSPFRCGTCTRCVDACPTAALVPTGAPAGPSYALDSRRCIAYWTVELRGPIPEENRAESGAHVFGCDICQDVCPWNRRAPTTEVREFQNQNGLPALEDLAGLTQEEFNRRFGDTPVERARYEGFLRNVAVAMGNSGNSEFEEPLRYLSDHNDPVVREHARWALKRLAMTR